MAPRRKSAEYRRTQLQHPELRRRRALGRSRPASYGSCSSSCYAPIPDFNAFCLAYFPETQRLFAAGMDRQAKTSLLLEREEHAAVLRRVRGERPKDQQTSQAIWRALLRLDRDTQWGALLSSLDDAQHLNQLVLVHGHKDQNLPLFVRRIEEHLRDKASSLVVQVPLKLAAATAQTGVKWGLHLAADPPRQDRSRARDARRAARPSDGGGAASHCPCGARQSVAVAEHFDPCASAGTQGVPDGSASRDAVRLPTGHGATAAGVPRGGAVHAAVGARTRARPTGKTRR